MEPRIHYAKASDGVNIAYWTLGDGPPLIDMFEPLLFAAADSLRITAVREWYERLAGSRQVVRFDHRGSGLSTRGGSDFSLNTMQLDVKAVVDRLESETVDLLAGWDSGPIAIAFAVHHPELVRRLILWSTWANTADITDRASIKTLESLIDTNWRLYIQSVIGSISPGALDVTPYVDVAVHSTDPGSAKTFLTQAWEYDVGELLARVRCPTLVLQRWSNEPFADRLSADLASRIPDAQLLVWDGAPWGDLLAAGAIDDFLAAADSPGAGTLLQGLLRTVLFTDIVGHTEMMSRLGDERGREVLREHERITREVLKAHGGTEVKTMGDGFMASFGSVTRAVECAVALQRGMDERNRGVGRAQHGEDRGGVSASGGGSGAGRDSASTGAAPLRNAEGPVVEPISIRVGLNAGEPIEEEGPDGRSDLFGATVILASRIAARAEGGEILVADTVRGLCSGKGFSFADRGEFTAKGFEEPVRVFEVRWSFDSSSAGATGGSG